MLPYSSIECPHHLSNEFRGLLKQSWKIAPQQPDESPSDDAKRHRADGMMRGELMDVGALPQKHPQASLLRLPRELRDQFLDDVFAPAPNQTTKPGAQGLVDHDLLRVCQALYEEERFNAYRKSMFVIQPIDNTFLPGYCNSRSGQTMQPRYLPSGYMLQPIR